MLDVVIGILTLVASWSVGSLAGRLARRALPAAHARHWAVVLAGILVMTSPLAFCAWIPVGLYDALLLSICFGAAALAALRARPETPFAWKGLALAVAILTVGLAGAEAYARRLHPRMEPPPIPPETRLLLRRSHLDIACAAIEAARSLEARPEPRIPGRRRTLLLGDSMLGSYENPISERFGALVQRALPEEEVRTIAAVGTGPDVYYFVFRRALSALRPDEALVFFFLENDFREIDQPHGCCGLQPILDYSTGAATLRCQGTESVASVLYSLQASPAPFLLRSLIRYSVLAEVLADALVRTSRGAWSFPPNEEAQIVHALAAFRAMHAEAEREHVAFKVVLLSSKWDMARNDAGANAIRERVTRELRAAGIVVYDTWDAFRAALAADPNQAWFQPQPFNSHFGVAGNRLVADWLLSTILVR